LWARLHPGKANSVFDGQSADIDSLLAHFPNTDEIAERTLEEKIADAKRSLSESE
jgi:hypothetical protein